MINLYIDFDGVIMDTINVTYKMLSDEGIDMNDEVAKSKFYSKLDWKKLLATTPDINDGLNCVQKIIDSNKFNVAILTHVHSIGEAVEKIKFIRKYFKDITIIPVPKEISKTKVVHSEGAILVDDYSGNLKEWEDNGGVAVRFSKDLESHGFKVINKLDQLIDMFESEE